MKLNYILCFGLFLFVKTNFQLHAATIDSVALIQSVKNAENDSVKVLALGELARYYAPFDNEKALTNYKSALYICENYLSNGTNEFYEKEMGALFASKGVTEYMVADYYNAINSELKAIAIFEKYGIKEKFGRCYVVIGAIYSHQGQVEKALKYQLKSYVLSKELKDSSGIALALNNIGISYFNLDSNLLAIKNYKRALNIYKKIEDKRGIGVELLNLGSLHKKLNNMDSAIFYFQKTIALRNEINDEQGLIFSYARLGQAYLERKKTNLAIQCGLKSLDLANKKQYTRGIRDANELLALAYKTTNEHKKAYEHLNAYHTAKDSMTDAESISRVAKSKSEFKFRQEALTDSLENEAKTDILNAQIAIREIESRQKTLTNYILLLGVFLAIVHGIWAFKRFKKEQKQNSIIQSQKNNIELAMKELSKRDEEKELLLKEIHHRVKNNLQVISSLLELQAKKVSDAESEVFKEGQSRVRAMALIHEELYQNNDLAEVDFKAYTAKLSRQIKSLFPGKEKVSIQIEGPEIKLDIDTAIPLGLIINELVTNAFKYGIDKNGSLHIEFTKHNGSGNYTVKVIDKGGGLPKSFDIKQASSLGLRLVNRLSLQLYGKTTYSFNQGSTFTINFKDTLERKKVA